MRFKKGFKMELNEKRFINLYKICYMIRCFENKVEIEFEKGNMRGTTHGCIGQEIIPATVMEYIDIENDYVVGTHRCHGQVLAYTKNPYRLICEMTGKVDGFVHGMGGSQHIKVGKYMTNGITGGMATIGCGIAMGIKKDDSSGIVVAFIGDGGFNEGYVQESLNLASHFELPILFVCENNHYAMSTPTEKYSAGTFQKRINSLNIKFISLSSCEIKGLNKGIADGFDYVRSEKKPCFLEIKTARLCGHSKSDKREYMTDIEKKRYADEDPLKKLMSEIDEATIKVLNQEIEIQLEEDFKKSQGCDEMYLKEIN